MGQAQEKKGTKGDNKKMVKPQCSSTVEKSERKEEEGKERVEIEQSEKMKP